MPHNGIEEAQVYLRPQVLLDEEARGRLHAEMRRDIEDLPPRFTAGGQGGNRKGRHRVGLKDIMTSVKRRLESSNFLKFLLPHASTLIPFSEFHVSLLSALLCGRLTPARRIIRFGGRRHHLYYGARLLPSYFPCSPVVL
jgi:hypothetical protein